MAGYLPSVPPSVFDHAPPIAIGSFQRFLDADYSTSKSATINRIGIPDVNVKEGSVGLTLSRFADHELRVPDRDD